MRLQGDQIALYLSGQDVPIQECNIVIHQPTIKQIVMFKETTFISAMQLFSNVDDNVARLRELNPLTERFSDFQLLMAMLNQDDKIKKNVNDFFELIFPLYKIEMSEDGIHFYYDDQKVGIVNSYNYQFFCNTIDILFGLPTDKKKYNPANKKAEELAKKFRKRAEALAKQKGKTDDSPSLFGSYVSILSIGMNMDIMILFNYTPFQLYDAFNRYWKKVQNDFYQRVTTMPMMDTSKMEEPES
jgi:hypothetical protein